MKSIEYCNSCFLCAYAKIVDDPFIRTDILVCNNPDIPIHKINKIEKDCIGFKDEAEIYFQDYNVGTTYAR